MIFAGLGLLWLVMVLLGFLFWFFILYLCIRLGVRDGQIAAHDFLARYRRPAPPRATQYRQQQPDPDFEIVE